VLIDYASEPGGRPDAAAVHHRERQWRWEASPLALNARALERAWPDNVDYLFGAPAASGRCLRRRGGPVVFPAIQLQPRRLVVVSYYLHVLSLPAVAMVIGFAAAIGWWPPVWRTLGMPSGSLAVPPGILGLPPGPGHL
jgi:hypothetical protein